MTIFGLLELGRRALQAHQAAIQIRGHNVANAQTPGYSRQRVELAASLPESLPVGQLGTGVALEGIRRLRDQFLDLQFRQAASSLGEAEVEEATFRRIQALLEEPSDRGLGSALARFFASLQELATDPTDLVTRFQVRERGLEVASTFRRLDGELGSLTGELEGEIGLRVREVNDLAGRIADLNRQIRSLEVGGASANDLRDRRDSLLDDLASTVALTTLQRPDGTVAITVSGGILLVDGTQATPMAWENRGGRIQLLIGGNPIQVEGGRLKGLLDSRNDLLPSAQATLDELALGLIREVNRVHEQGYGLKNQQGPFFSGTGAADMGVDPRIQQDVSRIAAAALPDSPGDTTNARALAGLRQALTMNDKTATFEGFFGAFVGEVGLHTQGARRLVDTHQAMVETLSNRREEVMGVSVDEELTHLIQSQRIYQASAHFVKVVDGLLETLLRELG